MRGGRPRAGEDQHEPQVKPIRSGKCAPRCRRTSLGRPSSCEEPIRLLLLVWWRIGLNDVRRMGLADADHRDGRSCGLLRMRLPAEGQDKARRSGRRSPRTRCALRLDGRQRQGLGPWSCLRRPCLSPRPPVTVRGSPCPLVVALTGRHRRHRNDGRRIKNPCCESEDTHCCPLCLWDLNSPKSLANRARCAGPSRVAAPPGEAGEGNGNCPPAPPRAGAASLASRRL